MSLHSATHAGLLAGAVTLALADPAGAATVFWQAGPLALEAGKVAQVAISNPNLYTCMVGVQIYAGPPSRVAVGASAATMTLRVNTITDPDIMPPQGVTVVGFADPEEMPGQRELVTAVVRCDCRNVTAADMRAKLPVTLQIGDPNIAETTAVLAATPR